MTNKMSKTVIIGSIICSLVLLGVLSTFAYMILSPTETKEDLGVGTGTLSLTFTDANPGFNKQLEFGSSAEKTFSITNDGTLEGVAKINWKNITNTYLEGSLTYSLSYRETEDGDYTDIITNELVPRSETPSTIELANGLVIPPSKAYYYKLTLTLNYLDDIDQTADLNAILATEFSVEEGSRNLVKTLLTKANKASITDYNTGVKEEMFTFTHPEAEQTKGWSEKERTDYRYIGNVPNNYIEFNNEVWRIIGVFTVEGENNIKEQRVKIIRNISIEKLAWDSENVNEWPTSSLFTLLNSGDYYNRTGNYSSNGLTTTAKNLIAFTKWYLGGFSDYKKGGPDYYSLERGVETCVTTEICSGETRNVNWIANIGLMYPSDYLYTYANGVDNTCYTNGYNCDRGNPKKGWIFSNEDEWSISPSSIVKKVIDTRDTGFVSVNGINLTTPEDTRPCVYLRKDIQIVDGDGTQSNPYKIK